MKDDHGQAGTIYEERQAPSPRLELRRRCQQDSSLFRSSLRSVMVMVAVTSKEQVKRAGPAEKNTPTHTPHTPTRISFFGHAPRQKCVDQPNKACGRRVLPNKGVCLAPNMEINWEKKF